MQPDTKRPHEEDFSPERDMQINMKLKDKKYRLLIRHFTSLELSSRYSRVVCNVTIRVLWDRHLNKPHLVQLSDGVPPSSTAKLLKSSSLSSKELLW